MNSIIPEVTVFIPSYNRLERLKDAVESVLSQGNFVRLHVLDNASDDGTAVWLSKLQENDRRVQLTLRKTNIGATKNFVDGFASTKTPYVVPLADDDELAPGFLRKSLDIIKNQPDLGAVIFVTESRVNKKTTYLSPPKLSPGRHNPKDHLLLWGENGHYVSWSSILWETETIKKHVTSGELERFGPPSDAWIQYLVFSEKPVFLNNEVGSFFNEHEAQCSKVVGPGVIIQIGQMINSIDHHLANSGVLTSHQKNAFLKNYCGILCGYLMGLCQNITIPPEKNQINEWWDTYIDNIYPYVGLNCFPLLPLFEQHKQLRLAMPESLRKAEEYDRLRRSPVWIIVDSLMRIDQITRARLPKSVKAYIKKLQLKLD